VQRGRPVPTTGRPLQTTEVTTVSISQPTTSRRAALQNAFTAALAVGAASLVPPAANAAQEATTARHAPVTIDAAEALLLDVERIMLQLDPTECSDLSVELDRLRDIAESSKPAESADGWPRNTGDN